ncbi:MAG: hypothetical protein PHY29_02780 [Syntrophales bacterium]|nr:hypothetical protein [Syntrophales bacterium]
MMTLTDALVAIDKQGYVQDIGQLSMDAKRMLQLMVKKGFLLKSREYWTGGTAVMKTTYRNP